MEDFLEITRKRQRNPTAIAKVQITLLQELIEAEGIAKKYRGHIDDLKAQKSAAPDDQQLAKEIVSAEREQFVNQIYANCVRTIADGIAWRSLGYDRAALRALCENPTGQQLMSEGLLGELYEWTLGHQYDGLAILNSITNWLAIGDITLVKDDGSVEIVEVKSSNASSNRVVRQKQRMKRVASLMSNGKGTMQGQELEIITLAIDPENGLAEVGALLREAEQTGFAAKRISNSLYVQCFDVRGAKGCSDELKAEVAKNEERNTSDWASSDDFVLRMDSFERLAFSPNCAPLSIYPFPARTCVDLMIGSKWFTSYLNLDAVAREFGYRGWEVEKRWDPQVPDLRDEISDPTKVGFIAFKEGCYSHISPGDFMRMHMEFLRPQVVISASEFLRSLGPEHSSRFNFLVYEKESDIWN